MAVQEILLMLEARETISRVGHVWKLDHALPYDDPAFPHLRYLDPYGKAIFNPRQMDELVLEWDRLTSRLQTDEEREIHSRAARLFAECRAGVHLYICFDGD